MDKTMTEAYRSIYLDKNDDTAKDTFLKNVLKMPYVLDIKTFHKGFDCELNKLGLLCLFDKDGKLLNRSSYGIIKQADGTNGAVIALKKFWALQFSEHAKTPTELNELVANFKRWERNEF